VRRGHGAGAGGGRSSTAAASANDRDPAPPSTIRRMGLRDVIDRLKRLLAVEKAT
jgi:hypothetical protein